MKNALLIEHKLMDNITGMAVTWIADHILRIQQKKLKCIKWNRQSQITGACTDELNSQITNNAQTHVHASQVTEGKKMSIQSYAWRRFCISVKTYEWQDVLKHNIVGKQPDIEVE